MLLERLRRFLFGYDFFISYSRIDGTEYAMELGNFLIEKNYSCYIDLWGTEPGKELPKSLNRIVKNSKVLILLATDRAGSSESVSKEIDIFLPTKNPIIPISFGDIQSYTWFQRIEGIAVSNEPFISLKGHPSEDVKSRILNSFSYTKQTKRIRNAAMATSILLVMLISLIGYAFFNVRDLQDAIIEKETNLSNLESDIRKGKREQSLMQASLDVSRKKLIEEQSNVRIAQEKVDSLRYQVKGIEEKAATYLLTAQKRAESAQKLLKFVEDGISFLYTQPSFKDCKVNQNSVTLYVYNDRLDVKAENKKLLDSLISCLKSSNKNYEIHIDGHASKYSWLNEKLVNNQFDYGDLFERTQAYTISISQASAGSVARYLIKNGIDPGKVTSRGLGNTRLKYPLDFMNKRVEVNVEIQE